MFGAPINKQSDPAPWKPAAPLMAVASPADRASASRSPEDEFRAESPGDFPAEAFTSEDELARMAVARTRRGQLRNVGVGLIACLVVGTGSWFTWQAMRTPKTVSAAARVSDGTASFNSSPEGATIAIDGVVRGITPVRVSLPAGEHKVTITSGDVSRTLPLVVDAGAVVSQYVELAIQPPSTGGRVEVGSDPVGADVRIDGVLRGVTPLVVADVPVGQHRVTVSRGDAVVNRIVSVARGTTATVVVSTGGAVPTAAAAAGWLTFDAPFEMEVYEGQQLVGTTRSDRIMLPVGSHDLELTNANLEFTGRRTVAIAAGKTANLSISLPSGKLSVNAVPWADVSIDGRPAGTTPLGNLTVTVGTHEVLWRHPQLGERRQTVTVKAQSPTRVGVDFSK
jgi:hypothetical protein